MDVIALEGSSFAGKSTISRQLGNDLNAPIIGEYIDYAKNGFPPFANSRAELDDQIDYYLDLEAQRKRTLASASDSTVIVDRTAASLVAFQKAMLSHETGTRYHWDPEQLQARIKAGVACGAVIVPRLVFVVSAGSKETHDQRVAKRGMVNLSALNEWTFSESIRSHTLDALDTLFPSAEIVECINDGNPDLAGQIVDKINSNGRGK